MPARDALLVDDLVRQLAAHPLHARVRDADSLRAFMRTHVFCVWDFQSLLKALQRALTCVDVPWLPTADPAARRLVNEIVLDEESDAAPGGGHLSHFELYVQAMREAGADTGPIDGFIARLRAGGLQPALAALDAPDMPRGAARFVRHTLGVAQHAPLPALAAVFAYGREEIIPLMFQRLVASLAEGAPRRWSLMRHYLERHIQRDGDAHGPAARALVARLCGDDERRWAEAREAARAALLARISLWDALLAELPPRVTAPEAAAAPSGRTADRAP